MIVFYDIISGIIVCDLLGDEVLSDSYKIKEIDGMLYEVDCSMITKGAVKVDIGANPSAEGEDCEDAPIDESGCQVIDVVDTFRLEQTSFDKKSFISHIKGYLKELKTKVQDKSPDRVSGFEDKAKTLVKGILDQIDDYTFYTGDSMNPEAMTILMKYREDGKTPYLIYWKDGLRSEKF